MKCELCHQNDAETAISLPGEGEELELYVCRECARKERVKRQNKSQRTRKAASPASGMTISVSGVTADGDGPPPIIEAIMNAVSGMVSDLGQGKNRQTPEKEERYVEYPCGDLGSFYTVGGRLHLEGLHIIGELEAVHRAARALKIRLSGVEADGVRDAGHVYSLSYACDEGRASRFVADLVEQEGNARARLVDEMPRVFGDSICRALAVLKNCRLLSPGELFDLLSPLRIAAIKGLLDGVKTSAVDRMLGEIDLSSKEDKMTGEDRDRLDAERADEMNRRFEDVVLRDDAEGRFL